MTEMIHEDDGAQSGAADDEVAELNGVENTAVENKSVENKSVENKAVDKKTVKIASIKAGRAQKTEQPTLRTSQGTQVRGYLESIVDSDFVLELQQALRHAQQLTGDDWRVEIRAADVEIVCDEQLDAVDISLDSVLDLASESIQASCVQAGQARARLPVPQPPSSKK